MAKRHVYHWKHGWIPLTHTAAMSKAKGNREKAAELLADAKSDGAGIHTREHVGKSALDLTSIADANERAEALVDVQDAAERLGAVDSLPSALRRRDPLERRMAKADAAMSQDAPLTAAEQAEVDAKFAAAAAKRAQRGTSAPRPSSTPRDLSRTQLADGSHVQIRREQGKGGDVIAVRKLTQNPITGEVSPASLAAAPYVEHATPDLMRSLGVRDEDLPAVMDLVKGKSSPKAMPVALKGGGRGTVTPRKGGGVDLHDENGALLASVSEQNASTLAHHLDSKTLTEAHAHVGFKAPSKSAVARADTPEGDLYRVKTAAPKAAPKSRAKGIILDGRTDENRYHYRKTDGTLEPQNDRVVNRLKRLEASARKAERDGDMFGAHKARQEFASITGEQKSVITYLPGSNASGAAVGLPDGYKIKRDVIDGYGPVSTYSAYAPDGKRVAHSAHTDTAAARAAHAHAERTQKAEAERVAMQERLKSERLAREAAHAKVVEDGRAAYAKPDTVDVADQVATNHLVERMHNAPGAMQAGELARIAGASHVAPHHRERAQTELNAQAFKRVQFMQGANDRRALNARLVDARSSMPAGPMRDALIAALERQLASLG